MPDAPPNLPSSLLPAEAVPVALLFPPQWYYAAVPADLLYSGSFLRARGVRVQCRDLSAGLCAELLGQHPAFQALRQPATYLDPARYAAASDGFSAACAAISEAHATAYDLFGLSFPGLDIGHLPSALAAGLSPRRNPALPYLRAQARALAAEIAPTGLIAIALVHPDQVVQTVTLGRLLREAGYRGRLVIYGSHEDVLAPEDFAPDLAAAPGEPAPPEHLLFTDFDGVIVGEAESALLALWQALRGERPLSSVPSLIAPRLGLPALPARGTERLAELPPPDFSLVEPAIYPYPQPVIDLRLSRGCPWGRCTFCAITAHQEGYRARPAVLVGPTLTAAAQDLGTQFFRFRDDLLTPRQVRDLSALVRTRTLPIRWSARARLEPGFTAEVLAAAAAAGLEELWLGLESASPRVRELMDKGVQPEVVERMLRDAAAAGIRVRALCIAGYPGETPDEMHATVDFLDRALDRGEIVSASLTPFQLMRRAPLGQAPERAGLTVLPDPVPQNERLRFTLRATWPGAPTAAELEALLTRAAERLGPRMLARSSGPSLLHAWLHESACRHGWPAPATPPSAARPPGHVLPLLPDR